MIAIERPFPNQPGINQAVDFRFCTYIHTPGGFSQEQHFAVFCQCTRQHDFLLIAAAQVADTLVKAGTPHIEFSRYVSADSFSFFPSIQNTFRRRSKIPILILCFTERSGSKSGFFTIIRHISQP